MPNTIVAATPATHAPPADIVERARALAAEHGTSLDVLTDPRMAVAGADAIYTDVWASRRPEESFEEHLRTFSPFQVNDELLVLAPRRNLTRLRREGAFLVLQEIEVPLIPVLARMEQRGVLIDGDLLKQQSRTKRPTDLF